MKSRWALALALLRFLGVSAVIIFVGLLIGAMFVILPPMAAVGLVGVAGLLLLWVAPVIPIVSDKWIRRLFFSALVVNLCVPVYYSYHGLSVRRLVSYPMLILFAIALATSPTARRRITDVANANAAISACILGYLIVAVLSLPTSINPLGSLTSLLQNSLEIYLPFLAAIYVLKNEDEVSLFLLVFFVCTLFITSAGILDSVLRKSVMVSLMPKFLLEEVIANFPQMARVAAGMYRAGQFRANSTFNNALSFGEFEAMIAAIATVFMLHGRNIRDKALGVVIFISCLVGIFVSESRGAYTSVIGAVGTLGVASVVRSYNAGGRSMKPAIFTVSGIVGLGVLAGAIMFVPAVNIRVFGGGTEQYSNDGRKAQWEIGIPKIETRPLTGRGFGQAADIIDYSSPGAGFPSVDSYLLAVLVETGVLGAATFFGAILISIWVAIRRYIVDPSWGGALMGGIGGALAGFGIYRLVLAQVENIRNMYFLIACVMVLNFARLGRGEQKAVSEPAERATKPRVREPASE